MTEKSTEKVCVNCGNDENAAPLINIHYRSNLAWICSKCLPVLIHKPAQLAGRLEGAEHLDPSPHDHD